MFISSLPSTPLKKLPALTGLRFFAAFFVFISHGLGQLMPVEGAPFDWYLYLTTLASEGMMLFFVLSGFVIHYNYASAIQERPAHGTYNFFVARFARLYPLFIVGLLFDLAHHYGYTTLTASFSDAISYYLTLTQSWFYIPLSGHALIYQFGHTPSVGWSVSTEWFFYLVYPLICFGLLKAKKLRMKLFLFLLVSIIFYCFIGALASNEATINTHATSWFGSIADENNGFQDCFYRWLIYFSPYSRIGEFLLGNLTAAIYIQLSDRSPSYKEQKIGSLLITCSVLAIVILHYLGFSQDTWIQLIPLYNYFRKLTFCFGFAPFLAIIIFCCARYNNIYTRFFSYPSFVIFGEASYSLYLFHMVIIEAFGRDAAAVSQASSWIIYLADFSRLILTFIAAMGFAILSYHMVELPARRFLLKTLINRNRKNTVFEKDLHQATYITDNA